MSDRPTPESDETHRLNCLPSTTEDTAYRYVLDLSRRLERERDEARDAAEKAKAFKRVMKEDNAKLRRELDELNKRLIEACQRSVDMIIDRESLRKEVAAERALADRLAKDLNDLWYHRSLTGAAYEVIESAITAWEEARK